MQVMHWTMSRLYSRYTQKACTSLYSISHAVSPCMPEHVLMTPRCETPACMPLSRDLVRRKAQDCSSHLTQLISLNTVANAYQSAVSTKPIGYTFKAASKTTTRYGPYHVHEGTLSLCPLASWRPAAHHKDSNYRQHSSDATLLCKEGPCGAIRQGALFSSLAAQY